MPAKAGGDVGRGLDGRNYDFDMVFLTVRQAESWDL